MLIWELVKDQLSLLFFQFYILSYFFTFWKNIYSILFFVDDGLLITQSKSFQISNTHLFSSYNVTFNLLSKFGLVVKHSKTEVFYFSRLQEAFSLSLLDLSPLGGPILYPKDTCRYLGFIFNRKLLFCQHIDFYTNKAISMVKYMKILSNLTRDLSPQQK